MNIDSHFIQGATHRVCEDYTLHGETDEIAYIIVCDGCSSAPHTDFGARLIAHSVEQAIREFGELTRQKLEWQLQLCKGYTDVQGLDRRMLLSTVLVAIYNKEKQSFYILMAGDGHCFLDSKEGPLHIDIQSPHNTPYYPAYNITRKDQEEYKECLKDKGQTVVHMNDGDEDPTNVALETGMPFIFQPDYPIASVILTTDGIDQVIDRDTGERVVIDDIITHFPSAAGAFAVRKLRFLKKTWNRNYITNADDIGIAGIIL